MGTNSLARSARMAVGLAGTLVALAAAAYSDADFDRQARIAGGRAQLGDIVTPVSGNAPQEPEGMQGRPGKADTGDPALDTGSSWFTNYTQQVNRQLRQREQLEEMARAAQQGGD